MGMTLDSLKASRKPCSDYKDDDLISKIESLPDELTEYDDHAVRQHVDYYRVRDKDTIEIKLEK